jgi:hypothetical protein
MTAGDILYRLPREPLRAGDLRSIEVTDLAGEGNAVGSIDCGFPWVESMARSTFISTSRRVGGKVQISHGMEDARHLCLGLLSGVLDSTLRDGPIHN